MAVLWPLLGGNLSAVSCFIYFLFEVKLLQKCFNKRKKNNFYFGPKHTCFYTKEKKIVLKMSYWYKDDELEEEKVPQITQPCFADIFIVEPSRQDRHFSDTYPEMVERAWILTRPPAGLYIRESTVTARQSEVARVSIVGDTDVQAPMERTRHSCLEVPPYNTTSRRSSKKSITSVTKKVSFHSEESTEKANNSN